jgi:Voltage-dependent anion channel
LPSKPEFAVGARIHSLYFWLTKQIETLDPGAFALVMATGIISNALLVEGQRELSDALLAVTLIAYCSLGVLTVLRAVLFWRDLRADLVNPGLVFSFFTIVAATGVFGSGIDLRGFASVAQALWVFALIAWLVMTYFSFGVLTFFNTLHLPHLLLRGGAGRSHANSVGGDGRGGHQHQCRRRPYPQRERGCVFDLDAARRWRRHAHHVGVGDLVDSTLGALRNLEAPRSSRAAELYAHALGPRVSAGHVFPGELSPRCGGGLSAAAGGIACHGVDCACLMARDQRRTGSNIVEEFSRYGSLKAVAHRHSIVGKREHHHPSVSGKLSKLQ